MNDNMEQLIKSIADQGKRDKLIRYHILNQYVKKGQILLTGSSLMEQFPINEFQQNYNISETIYNRGIGGFTSDEMLLAMDIMVFDLEPAKIFINIGTNDLNVVDYSKEDLIKRYESILTRIEERLPETRIYIMAYYPVNGDYDFGDEGARQWTKVRSNARINEANEALEQMAQRHEAQSQKTRFININKNLFDIHGNLKHEYSIEGVHMYANGYHAILDELMMYVREQ